MRHKDSIKDLPGIRAKKSALINAVMVWEGSRYVINSDSPQFQAVRES